MLAEEIAQALLWTCAFAFIILAVSGYDEP